jgi:hypothetical protein
MRELRRLHQALDLLLPTVPPGVAVEALRLAIGALASGHVTGAPRALPRPNGALHNRPGTTPAGDWEPVRARLHAAVASSDPAVREEIARRLMISPSTLRGICSTTIPGRDVRARAAEFIARVGQNGGAAETTKPPSLDGDEFSEAKGADGETTHLTSAMCDQLSFLIQSDLRAVRQSGVRLELCRHAALGGAVEPAIAERLIKFLKAG